MICVLKTQQGQYVVNAIARLRVDSMTMGLMFKQRLDDKVELRVTNDINQATLIENPSMEAVNKYNLTAIEVQADKPQLKQTGVIYDS